MRSLALLFLLTGLAFAGEPLIVLDYTGGFGPPRVQKEPMVGGEKKAREALATANRELKKAWPKAQPFTLAEMAAHGTRTTFYRREGKRWISVALVGDKVRVDKG